MVEVVGNTVGECLDSLEAQFPGIKGYVRDSAGKLHDYLEIYVNGESSYPLEQSKPVDMGDEIEIVAIMTGG